MSLGEFDVIKHYFTRPPSQPSVVKAVGDDCAVLSPSSGKQLVMSMDTLVSGRHFPASATPYQIATRALCTSLSDLAAMGAKPLYFTLGLTLPDISEPWLRSFSEGLFSIAEAFGIDLVGGDTTQGPLTITVQVHGEVDFGKGLMRHQAQVGDTVFVTGSVGDGAAALALLQGELSVGAEAETYLIDRFYAPQPQLIVGQQLIGVANAAIDVSDGLLADVEHIAKASRVNIMLNVEKLPIAACLQTVDNRQYEAWALSGGDDYQLLFTVSQDKLPQVNALIQQQVISATAIGQVNAMPSDLLAAGQWVTCSLNGKPYNYKTKGYDHFAP